jgi:hypothetical protein
VKIFLSKKLTIAGVVLPESKFIIRTGGSVVTRVIGTYPFGFSAISILNGTARIFRPAGLSVV